MEFYYFHVSDGRVITFDFIVISTCKLCPTQIYKHDRAKCLSLREFK